MLVEDTLLKELTTFQFCPEGNIKNRAGSEKCAEINIKIITIQLNVGKQNFSNQRFSTILQSEK